MLKTIDVEQKRAEDEIVQCCLTHCCKKRNYSLNVLLSLNDPSFVIDSAQQTAILKPSRFRTYLSHV